jgi:hypothetical protein
MVYMLEPVAVQARRLSSGTIASLTGETKYVVIDEIRDLFTEFCESLPYPCDKWQDAWERFEFRLPYLLARPR